MRSGGHPRTTAPREGSAMTYKASFPSSMQCSAGWCTETELCTLLSLSDQYGSILF